MTEVIKGISLDAFKQFTVATLALAMAWLLWGENKDERKKSDDAMAARIVASEARIAAEEARAEKLATIIAQNSATLQEVKTALTSGNTEIREMRQLLQGILRPFSHRSPANDNP